MGLTIHYTLKTNLTRCDDVRTMVGTLHSFAKDLPFQEVEDVVEFRGKATGFEDPDDAHRWLMIWTAPPSGWHRWRYRYGDEGLYEWHLRPSNAQGDMLMDVTVLHNRRPYDKAKVSSELATWLAEAPTSALVGGPPCVPWRSGASAP